MFLGNTLGSATSGLDSVERQLSVLSQNVANAGTPNYVRETTPLKSLDSAGGPAGVRTGGATRELDEQLQSNLFAAVGNEAGSNVKQDVLQAIDQASGAVGSGQDLASLVGALRDSFSALGADPANTTQQRATLDKAQSLVDGVHNASDALVQAQQRTQDALKSDSDAANAALHTIGQLSNQIIAARSAGQSTAALEDDRDGQMKALTQLTGAKFIHQSNGDIQVIAANSVLPTRSEVNPFHYDQSLGLQLNGKAPNGLGGEMGAYSDLGTKTLAGMQASLDGFAQTLASSFKDQKVPLFTDGAGNVPASGAASAGFSTAIQISSDFQASPNLLRDGTDGGRPAGDNTVINTVLTNVFSNGPGGVQALATDLIAGNAQAASQAKAVATTNTSLRTGLEARLSSVSGVSVDSELAQTVQLQAAYAANAKVITAVQSMWTQLIGVIQ